MDRMEETLSAGPGARRVTLQADVGGVSVGSDAPIRVQSMTNTDTADVSATVKQISQLARSGSELVRVTVNNDAAASAIPHIRDHLAALNVSVPLIGDFHYNGHKLLQDHPACAQALAKFRINPGNVGYGAKRETQFESIIALACRYGKTVRIGVNWGSLDQTILARLMDDNAGRSQPWPAGAVMREALVISALESAQLAIQCGLPEDHIILSAKVSSVQDLVSVYRSLAQRCCFPLHLGLTEAGIGSKGIVASVSALAVLLQEGIGDTIRVSLTPEPGADRCQEVIVAQETLQVMGLRAFTPMVTACPGCGRTTSTFFQELAAGIQSYVREQMPVWRTRFDGVEKMTLAVMGCVVNGPGESRHANIGISLPGTGESPVAPVFVDGEKTVTLRGDNIAADFRSIIENYVASHYQHKNSESI